MLNRLGKIFFIIYVLFLTSCVEESLSPQEQKEADYNNTPKIELNITTDLQLTISIVNFNFRYPINILAFELVFDKDALEIINQEPGIFPGPEFSSYTESDIDDESVSILFVGNLQGTGELIKFSFEGSESDYESTTISLRNVELLDSQGEPVEFEAGEFYIESVCFLDGHPTNGDTYGSFSWYTDPSPLLGSPPCIITNYGIDGN